MDCRSPKDELTISPGDDYREKDISEQPLKLIRSKCFTPATSTGDRTVSHELSI
jgi:hypothetical protein